MGDTLKVRFGIFWAHALEDFFSYWTASPVRDGRCKTSPPAPAIVSPVPYQSQDRLQMAGPLLSRRFWCAAGSLAPPTPFASTTGSALGQSHQSVAAATSPLGWQKDLGGPATPTSAHGLAQHIDHHPVDPATGVDPAAAERPARSTAALYWADHPPGGQCRLDGRFQRLVSHARQPARRAADGTRSVQPLCAGYLASAQPKRSLGSNCICAVVSPARFAASHARRQWSTVRWERTIGVESADGVVVGLGHSSRIHASSPTWRQRGPRANAWRAQSRNHAASGRQPFRAAAPNYSLGALLQSGATARGIGTEAPGGFLPEESAKISPTIAGLEVSANLSAASGALARLDQMARKIALYRSGLCWTDHWTQTFSARYLCCLLPFASDWRNARRRSWGPSSSPLSLGQGLQSKSVTYVLSSKCHPCLDSVPPRVQ